MKPVSLRAIGSAAIGNRHLRNALIGLLGAGLAGCATTGTMPLAHMHLNGPIKILVVPSPIKIDSARLRPVLAPDAKAKSPAAKNAIAQGVQHAEAYALTAMQTALGAQNGRVAVVAPSQGTQSLVDEIGRKSFAAGISQQEADRIKTATGADAVMRFRITDYGLTPTSWRDGYIAFEVSSTLALTAAIAYAGTTAAKAAAGAYLAQETVEETAEAYAGFRALDTVSRPVRIEAELVRLHPVATVWKSSDTGLSDTRLSRIFGKVAPEERNRQLEQATKHAVRDLMSDFAGVMRNVGGQAAGRRALARPNFAS